MLSVSYLTHLGHAKLNQIRMMRDRGHALSDLETGLLAAEADPAFVIHTFAEHALRRGCSLAEALSGTYAAAAVPTQGRLPDVTTIVYLDLQWEDAKRRSKMSSTDQVKSALDAARAALDSATSMARGGSGCIKSFAAPSFGAVPIPMPTPTVLVISPTPLTPEAKREIMDVGAVTEGGSGSRAGAGESVRVQVMLLHDLYVPLTEHALVPKHRRLAVDEVARFYTERNVHPTQVPVMPDNDPVAAYYDYREGDVIAVERPGSVEYRIVNRDLSA